MSFEPTSRDELRTGGSYVPTPTSRTATPSRLPVEIAHKVPSRRRDAERRGVSTLGSDGLPEQWADRPTMVLVHGPSRSLVNLALFAFSEVTTPRFQWVDVRVPGEERLPSDPVRLGWIPAERLWTADQPFALRPDDLGANLALYTLVRSDEPSASLVQLTEFLRLPELSQRILATRPKKGEPGVVAVPNAHRLMSAVPIDRVPAILGVHRSSGYSVYVGLAESPGAGAEPFDFVFEMDGESLPGWAQSHITCTKGIRTGPLREGHPVPLGDVSPLADVLSRLPAGR